MTADPALRTVDSATVLKNGIPAATLRRLLDGSVEFGYHPDYDGPSHGQVLRGVELLPIPLDRELANSHGEFLERHTTSLTKSFSISRVCASVA